MPRAGIAGTKKDKNQKKIDLSLRLGPLFICRQSFYVCGYMGSAELLCLRHICGVAKLFAAYVKIAF